jgi:hypothetical protein
MRFFTPPRKPQRFLGCASGIPYSSTCPLPPRLSLTPPFQYQNAFKRKRNENGEGAPVDDDDDAPVVPGHTKT